MKKISFLLAVFCLASTTVFGQMNHKKLFDAYLTGDLTAWGTALKAVEKESNPTQQTLLDAANYTYGYIAWLIEKNDKTEAQHQMKRLEEIVCQLQKQHYADSCIFYVYRSSIAAYEVKLGTGKMATNGLKAIKYCNHAVEMNPTNPMALSLKGNVDFYRPAIFGGNKKEALSSFKKSAYEFERQRKTANSWNYIASLMTMAQAYDKLGNTEEAIKICEKILKIAPNFLYVKNTFLPSLQKKKK